MKAPGEWQRGYIAAEQHGRGYMESPMSNARGGQNRRSAPVDDGETFTRIPRLRPPRVVRQDEPDEFSPEKREV